MVLVIALIITKYFREVKIKSIYQLRVGKIHLHVSIHEQRQ